MSLEEEIKELVLISKENDFNGIAEDLKGVLKVNEIKFEGETSLKSEKFGVKIGINL